MMDGGPNNRNGGSCQSQQTRRVPTVEDPS
jgi:hypothetical protein